MLQTTGQLPKITEQLQHIATRRQAFNRLTEHYSEKIYWYVRRIVGNHADACDVTQNTFVKAWENLEDFRFSCGLYTWLYQIATHQALNHNKKNATRRLYENAYAQYRVTEGHIAAPGDEIYALLEKAVATLPEKQRIVFVLRYFEEKSYAEIGEITGNTMGTLHATYHEAVKKVEAFLRSR